MRDDVFVFACNCICMCVVACFKNNKPLFKKKWCELLLINKSLFSSFSKFPSTKRIQGLVTDLNLFSDPSHRPSRSEKFPQSS